MASKSDNGLPSLSTIFAVSSRPWWEKLFFPQRARNRIAKRLLRVFEIGLHRSFTAYQMAHDMGMDDISGQCLVDEAIRYLLLKGYIEQSAPGQFRLRDYCSVTGVVDLITTPGKAILVSGGAKQPIYIAPEFLNGASHGDTVMAHIRQRVKKSLEAEVVRVTRFAQRRMVGNLEVLANRAYFMPDNVELFRDIEIPLNGLNGAENGDRVIVRITSGGETLKGKIDENHSRVIINKDKDSKGRKKNAYPKEKITAKVAKVLGESGSKLTEHISQLETSGFSHSFSDDELLESTTINAGITPTEISKRVDMRGVTTFTIDPAGTRDVDDALSIRPLEEGKWEVGIHIADVTHYIKAGSLLDRNAYRRATSIYFPDHVLPLFPERINKLCSLSPNVDSLAFSVLIEIDSKGKILKRRIAKTIIHSQRQFTYDEAQLLIDGLSGNFSEELCTLNKLAVNLRAARIANGAITFNNRNQLRFEFDAMGVTTNVTMHKRCESMKLIEEFMLLANRMVAEMMAERNKTFIYRTHGKPFIKMYDELRRVAANYGYCIKSGSPHGIAKELSKFLQQTEGRKEESLFTSLAIRSMDRAKYSIQPRSHFALSFEHYTHFTSPIRRYIDMVVHRMLVKEFIDYTEQTGIVQFETACNHFNYMKEKGKALQESAEQQKCAEFLSRHIGETFEGIIVNVTHTMLAVQLDSNGATGRVMLRTLYDDLYNLDEETYVVTGAENGNTYRIGEKVRVNVANIDINRGIIDFTVIEKIKKTKGS